MVYSKLFKQVKLTAIGFNFDIMYRFDKIIPSEYLFKHFADEKILKKAKLFDLGLQFALNRDGGKTQEVVFIKIPSELELAVHYNYHFAADELPSEAKLKQIYDKAYLQIDEIVEQLKF
jgi:hypothetical protein